MTLENRVQIGRIGQHAVRETAVAAEPRRRERVLPVDAGQAGFLDETVAAEAFERLGGPPVSSVPRAEQRSSASTSGRFSAKRSWPASGGGWFAALAEGRVAMPGRYALGCNRARRDRTQRWRESRS